MSEKKDKRKLKEERESRYVWGRMVEFADLTLLYKMYFTSLISKKYKNKSACMECIYIYKIFQTKQIEKNVFLVLVGIGKMVTLEKVINII